VSWWLAEVVIEWILSVDHGLFDDRVVTHKGGDFFDSLIYSTLKKILKGSFMSDQESQSNYSSITCGLLSLIFTLPAIAWPLGLFVVPFMFDAPGSENNFLVKLLAFSTIIYGPLYLIALKESHSLRKKATKKMRSKHGFIYVAAMPSSG
jgi:hypothetical protein